jgi:hypothetical protein
MLNKNNFQCVFTFFVYSIRFLRSEFTYSSSSYITYHLSMSDITVLNKDTFTIKHSELIGLAELHQSTCFPAIIYHQQGNAAGRSYTISPFSYSSPHQPPLTLSPYEPLTYFLQPRQSQHAFASDPLFITESGTIASLMVPFPS